MPAPHPKASTPPGPPTQRKPPLAALLAAAVAAVGGTERAGQLQMAEAVQAAVRDERHLLVQAGTGTGKSLAYLVPALLHAVGARDRSAGPGKQSRGRRDESDGTHGRSGDSRHQSGDDGGPYQRPRRVVVATATIALQAQIVDRDLPTIVDAVAPLLRRRPTYAMLKGRRNYVCLNKLGGGMPDDAADALFEASPSTQLGRDVTRLREWARDTRSGDRDELVPGVMERAWSQVSVSARECLGALRCPFGAECFAERARGRAAAADVVVTNHALLAIDAIEGIAVLPEHDVVVVDEAHELADRVTGVATGELTPALVERAATRAGGLVEDPGVDDLAAAAAALGTAFAALPEGRLPELPERLRTPLVLVRDAARRVESALRALPRDDAAEVPWGDGPDGAGDGTGGGGTGAGGGDVGDGGGGGARQMARAAVAAVHAPAERASEATSYDVVWLAEENRRGRVLKVAPLVVSGLLRERLFADRTVVLTSATLEVGGSFDAIARQVGLAPSAAERHAAAASPGAAVSPSAAKRQTVDQAEDALPDWIGVDVGSPFDYPRQGILYVARHLPPPGRDGTDPATLDELGGLIEAAGGRTLGLFSSMRAAQAATEAMRERLDVPVLCQGEGTTAELVRQLAADAPTCLFGTLSLWQGVDVPGSALQLVVVDRIPFPRPDDPLMSARAQAVSEAGGNGFMTVAAAHAGLRLAQGAGRLLRSTTDRGVVAVLDPRLATARYGSFLRASLPAFWFSTDGEQVRRSLAAIDASAPDPLAVREATVRRAAG